MRSLTVVRRVVGPEEVALAMGLALVTVGLWPVAGQVALTVPGLVLIWLALPQRTTFVQRTPTPPAAERQVR